MTAPLAARRWAEHLAGWAIPEDLLARAPEPPWAFPPELFARAADRALADPPGPSQVRAREALAEGDTVVDVGVGGGAGSLPLAPPAALLVGVDESEAMLGNFARAAEARGVRHQEVQGRWPDVAGSVRPADVAVCHHVFYNVADLVPFAAALDGHARKRVVVEMTSTHPQMALNRLWKELHGIDRPTSPTAGDAVAVLEEMGLTVNVEASERPSLWSDGDRPALVAFARRRLCLGPDRDPEIDAALGPDQVEPRRLVTIWWDTGRQVLRPAGWRAGHEP